VADRSQDIRNRTFEFACGIARLALKLEPQSGEADQIARILGSIVVNTKNRSVPG
jgi:hypothetical protein